ncbi:MAG: acetate kinase [Cyanosarcina radialis HA8281-LM2]|jgi:acetate kinase|nr:acetate kinase [Cyanosarcina radialis HA8281-LM2]
MKILVLNAGSSSQKSCLYEISEPRPPDRPPTPLWEATVDWTHHQGIAEIEVKTAKGETLNLEIPTQDRAEAIARMLDTLWEGKTKAIDNPSEVDVVGHRVVHGGQDYRHSVRITADVKAAIDRLTQLAPVHNRANLEGIEAIDRIFGPNLPQIAVFDTAFHSSLPDAAAIYPGPYRWVERGIRRYGFHGISHQYCARRAAQLLNRDLQDLRLIVCHLGNGCSLSAVSGGESIDTTMGFTPLDGLMMGTRSGAVDPGILIHLMRQEGYSVDRLDRELNQESGLKGISGVAADLRQIATAIETGNAQAQLALDIFIHRLRSSIGAMLASLGGLDALVFTAGIGENSALVRALACQNFDFIGLKLEPEKNQDRPVDRDIAAPDSKVRILVIHTQEDWAIAQQCWRTNHQVQ